MPPGSASCCGNTRPGPNPEGRGYGDIKISSNSPSPFLSRTGAALTPGKAEGLQGAAWESPVPLVGMGATGTVRDGKWPPGHWLSLRAHTWLYWESWKDSGTNL